MTPVVRLATVIVRLQHAYLAPLVVFAISPAALLQGSALVALAVAAVGLAGTILGRGSLATLASTSLLALLIWGKASANILKTGAQDTAVLIIEFTLILFLTEAFNSILRFNMSYERLKGQEDELSDRERGRLMNWLRGILTRQAQVSLAVAGLSIFLLPVAGFTSIGSTQLVFTATLLFLAVILLLFLVTHRREPEER